MSTEMPFDRPTRLLSDLYGRERTSELAPRLADVLGRHQTPTATRRGSTRWSERDAWLITYPDQIRSDVRSPLATLHDFYLTYADPAFNGMHVLPFFPSTSDEGFSISDYSSVAPHLGAWSDIEAIAGDSRLMVDAVVNHCSVGSEYFRRWSAGDRAFRDFFRTVGPGADLSGTVRAREHPLLTTFTTARGPEAVWTTFSPDQVDFDYRNPEVLLFILSILLSYARHGASMIRLDAACFLWKREGTPSIHLPETHRVIQFFRACLDATYPHVVLVSETNVPHDENISYLGDGSLPEADMVYRFTLPPLVLDAFSTGQATGLAHWLENVAPTPPGTTFLNFLASHDGVGLRPLEGLVDDSGIARLVRDAESHGGRASHHTRPDGTTAPYELNATWYDLVRGPTDGDDALTRHLASHAIMFAVAGVPAVYMHALLASGNDLERLERTDVARSINRGRFDEQAIRALLSDPMSRTSRSLSRINEMLRLRRSSPAFHPDSPQEILETPPTVIGIERTGASGDRARVYVNVSGESVDVPDGGPTPSNSQRAERTSRGIHLGPWGFAWLIDRGEEP